MSRPEKALLRIEGARVAVVGDVMLDHFVHGTVTRLSPEAPVPVLESAFGELRLGGAANVAHNLMALGAYTALAGTVGRDPEGAEVFRLCAAAGLPTRFLLRSRSAPTTLKTRFVAGGRQVLRVDRETKRPLAVEDEGRAAGRVETLLRRFPVVVVQDYGKGFVTLRLLSRLRLSARRRGTILVVDPALGRSVADYAGAALLLPNRAEAEAASGIRILSEKSAEAAARRILRAGRFGAVALKLGPDGIHLVPSGGRSRTFRAPARAVFDVTGAGDTTAAVIAAVLAGGGDLESAVHLGAFGGAVAVGKAGTATITLDELARAVSDDGVPASTRVVDRDRLPGILERERRAGRRIVFTNGCFDLLHPGHLATLSFARSQGDVLVVGVNSDRSVRALKGRDRPVQKAMERAEVLASLRVVDYVTVFDEDTPLLLIKEVRPDVLVKGADWQQRIVGAEDVVERGGRVVLAPLLKGRSTSALVRRIERKVTRQKRR